MGKVLLGPNGGSGGLIEGRFGERCGGNGVRGGSMSGVGEGILTQWVEWEVVNGGCVDLRVSKRLLLEVAEEMIGESGGIEVGGGADT
ncbi:hypothetical protein Tco_0243705 [Tanacetum coccineum]